MAQVRRVNKKWRHEQRRKKHTDLIQKQKLVVKIQQKKHRQRILEARRAVLDRREDEIEYVNQLKEEVNHGQQAKAQSQKPG